MGHVVARLLLDVTESSRGSGSPRIAGGNMASANDQDVERAIAALGGPSIAYHSFRTETVVPPPAVEARAPSAFPLLVAALPEAGDIPIPSSRQPDTASVDLPAPDATPSPSPPAQPVMAAPTPPPPVRETARQPPAPALPIRQPEPTAKRQRFVDRPQREPRDTAGTSLAAMFHILKSGSVRVDQPREQKSGLQDLFRRL